MKAEFVVSDLVKQGTIMITIKGMGKFRAQIFVARILFWLGSFVLGCGIDIEET